MNCLVYLLTKIIYNTKNMHVHVFIRSFACCSYSTLILSVKYKVSNNIETLNSPTLVQDILQVSEDRRLCVVCKSFAYQIRISKGKIASLDTRYLHFASK